MRVAAFRFEPDWLEDRLAPAATPAPSLAAQARLDTTGASGSHSGPLAKVGFDLALLAREYQAAGSAAFAPTNSLLQIANGSVAVEAIPAGNPAALQASLAGLGFVATAPPSTLVSGWLPIASIPAAAGLPGLVSLSPAYRFVTSAGATTSQGDAAERSDEVRGLLGLTGAGITIGVISDSYNLLGGAAADVASGDLPGPGNPEGDTIPVEVLSEGGPGGTDEGRAMLQVIHDVATGARLLFAAAGTTQAQLAASIRALANAGADIIVDDVTFPSEPMFQDGIVAQAVDQVAAAGVVYFSAAGNLASQSYQSAYRDSGVNLGTSGAGVVTNDANFMAQDFDPGPGVDLYQTVTLPAGTTTFSFQWSNSYASAGGPGAVTDMDLALFDMNGVFLSTIGGFNSNIGGDPTEVFQVDAGSGGQYRIALGVAAGPDPALVKYVAFAAGFQINTFATDSSTVFGHANAAGAAAVGAVRYTETPRFGVDPPVAEPFTGRGGTPILFDTAGNPQTADVRPEPRFAAPDGVDTTFFGATDDEPDGFPNFGGTSAAAPHAAAVAALMLQANRTLTPTQVFGALAATALDVGPAGFDYDTGAGLIQALPAVIAVGGPFDVTLDGTTGNDTFLVVRDPSGADVEFYQNGSQVLSLPVDKLGRVTVRGGAGSDTLTVDYTYGAPLTSAGLSFAGGESPGDSDRLVLTGYDTDTVVVNHDGPETGTVQVGTTPGLVSFSEIEPLVLAGTTADLFLNLPATPNPAVAVGDDGGPVDPDGPIGLPGFSAVSGSTFEYTRFRNPTHELTVTLGSGGDSVAVRSMDPVFFPAGVAIVGGSGADSVTLFDRPGNDAVTYTPDAADGGVVTLAAGPQATPYTLSGIESLAADGLGGAGPDSVSAFAPRLAVAFAAAAGSGVFTPASAAGVGWLPLVFRNFAQTAVTATVASVAGTANDDTIGVGSDGVVSLGYAGGVGHQVQVTASELDLDGFGGADQFTVAANHPFAGGVFLNGEDGGAAGNTLTVIGSGGAMSATPDLTGQVSQAGYGVIQYTQISALAISAGVGWLTLGVAEGAVTTDVLLTGGNTATVHLASAAVVSVSAAG
ncbi:MAG TPA: S8 family serine peptidase, partial [Urbifossiella sp.]|nr:S8 family serine peptidase [Urbifossiella sp.]